MDEHRPWFKGHWWIPLNLELTIDINAHNPLILPEGVCSTTAVVPAVLLQGPTQLQDRDGLACGGPQGGGRVHLEDNK